MPPSSPVPLQSAVIHMSSDEFNTLAASSPLALAAKGAPLQAQKQGGRFPFGRFDFRRALQARSRLERRHLARTRASRLLTAAVWGLCWLRGDLKISRLVHHCTLFVSCVLAATTIDVHRSMHTCKLWNQHCSKSH
ncbi:hypothetical protein RRG08_001664 [Elysia crispata]|uniref:Uncharacterized protein n=1 Tax=Elysia crispata TaxID=231223 RepID=A0AAE1AJV8_9GAST|nr:hypothetical protein RRG08_001664 [Elysia crispata]